VELDAAIDMARRQGAQGGVSIDEARRHRADLALREARGLLDGLRRPGQPAYPLGDWLNLIARARRDRDLASLRSPIETAFRDTLQKQAATELETARRELGAGRVVASLRACDRIARLLPHMAADVGSVARREAEDLVARLVEGHGVALETPRGDFILGSFETYRSRFVPVLADALESRGYLPYRETSPWKSVWRQAKYLARLEVSERLEGNYLSSQNRLTRIEARLTLMVPSSKKVVWRINPTARTSVPVPGLPAGISTRLAVNPARTDEDERLLYDDARGQIDGKFAQALHDMPECSP
jgi:hypothetical protein